MGVRAAKERFATTAMIFAFVAAYALDAWLQTPWFSWWLNHRHWGDFIVHVLGGLAHGYGPLLYGATAMAAVATLARFERAGLGTRFRAFAKRHPVVLHRVLPGMVGALWVASNVAFVGGGWRIYVDGFELGTLLAAIAMGLVVRAGVAELERVPSAEAVRDADAPLPGLDDTTFTAVAVTSATRTIVGALALASVAMVAFVSTTSLLRDPRVAAAVVAYAGAALGAALLFRRVSRIVVGIDGILILGAGKTRFIGYATFDEIRATGTELLLVRGGSAVVRLQLHGTDVVRRDALVVRMREAMSRAAKMRADGAELVVDTSRHDAAGLQRLGSSSLGATDYRQPSVTRERLWEIVEGPSSDAQTRALAAGALATALDDDDRARLRVAAGACAEPRVRVALEKLADEAVLEEDALDVPEGRRYQIPG